MMFFNNGSLTSYILPQCHTVHTNTSF